MNYKATTKKGVLIIAILESITIYRVQQFKDTLHDIMSKNPRLKAAVISFEQVKYIDALALSALVAFSYEIRDRGGDVKVACLNEDLKLIFEFSQLAKTYEIYDTVDSAVASFPLT